MVEETDIIMQICQNFTESHLQRMSVLKDRSVTYSPISMTISYKDGVVTCDSYVMEEIKPIPVDIKLILKDVE